MKNFIITLMALALCITIESTIFYHVQCNKLKNRVTALARERNELQEEIDSLRKSSDIAKSKAVNYERPNVIISYRKLDR